MRAVVLTQLNAPLEIKYIHAFAGVNQVRVRVSMAGICGAQLQDIAGQKNNERFLPHCLGHEGVGIVDQTGEGVTTVQVGDKVVLHWMVGAGNKGDSMHYWQETTCGGPLVNAGPIHTWSESVVVSENRVTFVPKDTPDELCVLLGCALSTALGVCENEAKLKMGESVLVVGCGGVGLCCIAAAKAMGAGILHGYDFEDKGELALRVGADTFSKHGDEPKLARYQFDCILDTTGSRKAFDNSMDLLAPGGRYIMVGQPKQDEDFIISNARHLFDQGKTIKATQGGSCNPALDIPRWVRAWRSGHLKIADIITHSYPLDQVNEALDMLRSGQAGRVVLTML